MKRMQLIFPLMFLLALGGSAFSRHVKSTPASTIDAWYYDPRWNVCNEVQLSDDKCFVDNLAYPCLEYIGGIGYTPMWQSGFGSTCYQPYYQYVP